MNGKIEYIGKTLLIETELGEKILVFGDIHFGMEGNLRGLSFEVKLRERILDGFEEIFEKVGKVDRVIFLGDLKHNFSGIAREEWRDVLGMFDYIKDYCKRIIVIKGNHDNFLMNIISKWEKDNPGRDIRLVDYYVNEGFCFLHGDRDFEEIHSKEIKYWIMGHAHPAVVLREKKGIKSEKYKCFLVGKFKRKNVVIVPSFIEYKEGSDPRDSAYKLAWDFNLGKFDVKIIGENLEVLDFGKLRDLD